LKENIGIAIHGGAGTILKSEMSKEKETLYKKGLEDAINCGYEILQNGGSATDAVEKTVIVLEDNPLFNAGKGSVFNHKGNHEMDASIMDGSNLNAGAICCVDQFKNPIQLARLVMEKSEHVILTGDGAMQFGELMNCKKENENYFFDEFRHQQWLEIKDSDRFQLDHSSSNNPKKFGTVGAVAIDKKGSLAAATSTGGMTNKKFGRIGDSSIIGAGNYANNKTCAVSCTGSGEFFIRGVIAYDVSCLMEMSKMTIEDAAHQVIHNRLQEIGGDGGLIAIDNKGNITMPFNTEGMYRAAKSKNSLNIVEIY
jgi:L-asparaginase / beta-aspartyl-peptidase